MRPLDVSGDSDTADTEQPMDVLDQPSALAVSDGQFTVVAAALQRFTDDRPVIVSAAAQPISGGSLIITADGSYAVAADPERDRVDVVEIDSGDLVQTLDLNQGDEPGRLAEDPEGGIHVALRRAGAVVSFLPGRDDWVRRRVCANPRGIAHSTTANGLVVACRSGQLLRLPIDSGEASELARLPADLRDVVVQQVTGDDATTSERIFVTRFRSAELLRLGSDWKPVSSHAPSTLDSFATLQEDNSVTAFPIRTRPTTAWHTVASASGPLMLHQRGQEEPIPHRPKESADDESEESYGGDTCGGLVTYGITRYDLEGEEFETSMVDVPLGVDVALSGDGEHFAIAGAGPAEHRQLDGEGPVWNRAPALRVIHETDWEAFALRGDDPEAVCLQTTPISIGTGDSYATYTSVAFNPVVSQQLIAQRREPAALVIFDDLQEAEAPRIVELGGISVYDTGHELFHRMTNAGIACASCHPEGGDDGRIWVFEELGERRTQSLEVGLRGTEPFHWDGSFPNFQALASEVFEGRMGGNWQTAERVDALANWVMDIPSPVPQRAADDPLALQGRELFESPSVGCASCHAGIAMTSSASFNVGTTAEGELLQAPSLRGVAYRVPLMHNGCAATLRDRFEPDCGGGDAHGHTSELSEDEIGALIAYMESL